MWITIKEDCEAGTFWNYYEGAVLILYTSGGIKKQQQQQNYYL